MVPELVDIDMSTLRAPRDVMPPLPDSGSPVFTARSNWLEDIIALISTNLVKTDGDQREKWARISMMKRVYLMRL